MHKMPLGRSRCEGYTIFCSADPAQLSRMIDMNGNIVREWPFGGQPVKLLPKGTLLARKRNRMGRVNPLEKDPVQNTGTNIRRPPWHDSIDLIQVDWDENIEWSYCNWDDQSTGVMMSRQHHDFQREGNPVGYFAPGQNFKENGNTLILGHKNRILPEITDKELLDDVIYEVDWEGSLTGFEWYAADHFDEMGFDNHAKKLIYEGQNYDEEKGFCDWAHINSISLLGSNHIYEETKDERFNPQNIIFSSRNTDTVAILSRATGKIVWKIGPDFTKGTPEHKLGPLIGQHHAHMIPRNLPGEGNIIIFDNGGKPGTGRPVGDPKIERNYSRVIEFNPVTLEKVWEYGAESGDEHFFSHFISGMQRLPNGNTLITDGANGHLMEISAAKEIVWEYYTPNFGEYGKLIYRSYRIPPEWVPGNPSGYVDWADLY